MPRGDVRDSFLDGRVRTEVRRAWANIEANEVASTELLARKLGAEAEVFQSRAEAATVRLRTYEKEIVVLQKQLNRLRRRREAWHAKQHEDAVCHASRSLSDVARIRQGTQELAAQGREESKRLEEAGLAELRAFENQQPALDGATLAMIDSISKASRHAAALLEPGSELDLGTLRVYSATADWLVGAERGLRLVVEEGSFPSSRPADPAEVSAACAAIRASATQMSEGWASLLRGARGGREHAEREAELVEALHATRERNLVLQAEVDEKAIEADELRGDIDAEQQRTKAILSKQRWLVPRVAAAVEEGTWLDRATFPQ